MKYLNLIFLTFYFILLVSCNEEKEKPYTQTGKASYYALMLEGYQTASGVVYRKDSMTAAHRKLPLGTVVRVTNLENNKEVVVEVNDRGPYAKGRIIDLSRSAAKKLDMIEPGVVEVRVEVVEPAPGYTVSDSVVHVQ